MAFKGVSNTKLNGGLGRRNPSTDSVMGLVMGGVATANIALGTVKKLIQIEDAEALLLNSGYDSTNGVRVYEHIQQFFEFCPDGTLYIMLVAQGTTQSQMCTYANAYVKKLALDPITNKEIKVIGTVLNPATGYAPDATDGIPDDVSAAIPLAQALIEELNGEFVYVDGIVLEGRNIEGTIGDLLDLRTKTAPNVSVCIGADPAIIALHSDYVGSASVGTALGNIAVRKVSENVGSVDIARKPSGKKGQPNYSLTNEANGTWLTAALTSGVLFSSLTTAEKQALTDKGYIYVGSYEGYPGLYFNDSGTCVEVANDYAYIESNRVWNKAARYVRTALIPKMNSEVEVTDAGAIEGDTISEWIGAANKELDKMLADEEISSYTFYIDPSQNVLGGEPIVTKLTVVPRGIARKIENELGFTNPLTA